MTTEQEYENMARRMIYPDLRQGYKNHYVMIHILASTIESLERLAGEELDCFRDFGKTYGADYDQQEDLQKRSDKCST